MGSALGLNYKIYHLFKGEDASLDLSDIQVYFSTKTLPSY